MTKWLFLALGLSLPILTSTAEAEVKYKDPPATISSEFSDESELSEPIIEIVGIAGSFWEPFLDYSWPVMALVLGGIDGFNPCAMWSLMILIGFLLSIDSRKTRWIIGGVFIGSSFLLYGAALLAYLWGFQQISLVIATGGMTWVFRGVGLVGLITGGMMMRQWRKAGVDCSIKSASEKHHFRDRLKELFAREKLWLILPGVTALAFSVNAIELLCSFAIPTAFTASLVGGGFNLTEQLLAVLIYDIAYIFDDLLVFTIAMWTLSLKIFSNRIVQWSHLVGGFFLVILSLILLFRSEWLVLLSA